MPGSAAREYGAQAVQRAVVFSGTVATLGGELLFGERFEIELLDSVLGRRLQHSYTVQVP